MKRRRRARRGTRRALTLTAWRAVIVGQCMVDLARHGRLQALAALVLNTRAEIRDMQQFAELAHFGRGLALQAARADAAGVLDRRLQTWRQAADIFGRNADALEGLATFSRAVRRHWPGRW